MTERETKYQEYDERIDRYLSKQMSDDERAAFENDVNNDDELRKRLVSASLLAIGIAEAGNQQEGQAQINAIKNMSKEEFMKAMKPKAAKPSWLKKASMWTASIAAAAIIALIAIPILNQPQVSQGPVVAQAPVKKPAKAVAKAPAPAEPTLAELSDKYNKPVPDAADDMAKFSNMIRQGGTKEEMLALADQIMVTEEAAIESAKGAEDAEAVKEARELYNDCVHWYKALAFLKANDKASAISELTILKDSGKVEELITRATNLLGELRK